MLKLVLLASVSAAAAQKVSASAESGRVETLHAAGSDGVQALGPAETLSVARGWRLSAPCLVEVTLAGEGILLHCHVRI